MNEPLSLYSSAVNSRKHVSALACVAAVSVSVISFIAPTAEAATTYKNCTALNKVYPHGVGKKGAKDRTSSTPVKNFKVSDALYKANAKSDRDKDGIACEKR